MLPIWIGAISLGVVIAWLTRIFLDRVIKLPLKVFLSLVSVFTGAASTQLGPVLHLSTDCTFDSLVMAFYFIGLLCGFVTYPLLLRFESYVKPRKAG